jgi:hypothetical protein
VSHLNTYLFAHLHLRVRGNFIDIECTLTETSVTYRPAGHHIPVVVQPCDYLRRVPVGGYWSRQVSLGSAAGLARVGNLSSVHLPDPIALGPTL